MLDKNKAPIILIFPKLPVIFNDHPPLGIITIAAPLVKEGYNVIILDEQVEKDFDDQLLQAMKKNPVCIGITSMSGSHIKNALRICQFIKENSDTTIVMGGVHTSISPQATIENEYIDMIVRDDGEETFLKLVKALPNKEDLSQIKGIAYKNNGKIVFNEPAPPADIRQIPELPFYLVKLDNYVTGPLHFWARDSRALAIETSRGCPYICSFCTESVRKKKWRELAPEKLVSDIILYKKKYKTDNFLFVDDNFFANKKRSERIINLLLEEKAHINWYTNVRADFLNKMHTGFLKQLEQSGCRMLTFGAESGSPRILNMIEKNGSVDDVFQINKKLAKTSITPHYVTIRGFPAETKTDIEKTYLLSLKLLWQNKKAVCDSVHLIPTPGTKIMEMCLGREAEHYSLNDWEYIFNIENRPGKPHWVACEVYDFMIRNKSYIQIIANANRNNLKGFDYRVFRFFLLLSIICFSLKISDKLAAAMVKFLSKRLLKKIGIKEYEYFRENENLVKNR